MYTKYYHEINIKNVTSIFETTTSLFNTFILVNKLVIKLSSV